jgi:hypothetical protein
MHDHWNSGNSSIMNKILAALLLCAFTAALGAPRLDGSPIKGEVLESVTAGSYTYLRLSTADGELWAAIMQTDMPKGTKVQLHDPMVMTNFESKAMGRTFDQILFASAVSTETGGVASPTQQMAAVHKGAGAAAASVPVEKIAKAPGANARTVDEVYAQRAQLSGKPVVIRGKVVKFSADILERNWAHLRDGTGAAANGSNDLLVTTKQTMKVGEVVTVSGTVRTNADYGSGYAYPVVLESATLQK